MKESIGKKMLSSKFFKFCLSIALIVSFVSLFWDVYKYFSFHSVVPKRIIEDVILVGGFFILFKTTVKESPILLDFVRTKFGNIISWLIIIGAVIYSFEFPFNLVLSAFLLSLPALHYSIRYFGKKKRSNLP